MSVAADLRPVPPRPPFDALPEQVRAALREIGASRDYVRGDVVLAQGGESRTVRVVLSGRAKLTRDLVGGRTVVLALFGPGEFCGAIPALSGLPSDASIVALGPLSVLEIERDAFLELIAGRPELLGVLLPALAGRLTECTNCLVELTGERVESRLAALFLRLADDCGVAAARGVLVPIRLSRQELADLVGTTLETAIRIFSRWHKSGVLETGDDGFLLVDRGALESARGPSPA
ncbi:MAG: putative transcriptional regulator [Acidobacteriota bacterium]